MLRVLAAVLATCLAGTSAPAQSIDPAPIVVPEEPRDADTRLRTLMPRLRDAVMRYEAGPGADRQDALTYYNDMADLAEQVGELLLPTIEDFTYQDFGDRHAQIRDLWPLVEFSIVAMSDVADNLDAYYEDEDSWKLAAVRRLVKAVRGVWSQVVPELIGDAVDAGDARHLLADLLLFQILNDGYLGPDEIGEMLSATDRDPDGAADEAATARRDGMEMLLADFGLANLSGSFIAFRLVETEHGRFLDRLDGLATTMALTGALAWPDLQQTSREGDGERVLKSLALLIDTLHPVLAEALPALSDALESDPVAAAVPPVSPAPAVPTPQATADAAVPEETVTPVVEPVAPPVLLPDGTIEQLRSSLTRSEGYMSDSALDRIVAGFAQQGQSAALAQTLTHLASREENDRFRSRLIRTLGRMGPGALAAEDMLRGLIWEPDQSVNVKTDIARVLAGAGADLSDLATATAARIDAGTLSDFERLDALRLLGATGRYALPHMPRFLALAVSPRQLEMWTGLDILETIDTLHGDGWNTVDFEEYYRNHFQQQPEQAEAIRGDLEDRVAAGTDRDTLVWLFNAAGGDSDHVAEKLLAAGPNAPPEDVDRYLLPLVHLAVPASRKPDAYAFLRQHLDDPVLHISWTAAEALARPQFATLIKPSDIRPLLSSRTPHIRAAGITVAAAHGAIAQQFVDTFETLLADPTLDPSERGKILQALQAAGDGAAPAAAAIARGMLADDGTHWTAIRLLRELGPKARPAIDVLENTIRDTGLDDRTRLLAASLLLQLSDPAPPEVIDIIVDLSGSDADLISDAFTGIDWRALGEAIPLSQTHFEWLGSLIPKLSGPAQSQMIQAYVAYWQRAEGFDRQAWRNSAASMLLELPTVNDERVLIQALQTLEPPDRRAFDRVMRHARTTLQTYRDTGDNAYEVDNAVRTVRRLATLTPESGEDGRNAEAVDFYLSAIDVQTGGLTSELIRGLGELGPVESPLKDRVYQRLSALMEAETTTPEIHRATVDAMVQLAATSGDFLRPILRMIDVRHLQEENSRRRLRDIFDSLAKAQRPVIEAALDTLSAFYLHQLAENTDFDITRAQEGALIPIHALGHDGLVWFERFSRDKDDLGYSYFDYLDRSVEALQSDFRTMSYDDLTTAIGQLQSIQDALAERKADARFVSSQWGKAESALTRAISAARDRKVVITANWRAQAREVVTSNPYILAGGSYLAALLAVLLFSLVAPLQALNAYQGLARITTGRPKLLGIVQAPLLLKWILLNPRVLRAWTRANLPRAAASFRDSDTVRGRRIFHPLPVIYEGEPLTDQPHDTLVSRIDGVFRRRNIVHILIRGSGGSGKTSLACRLGNDAIEGILSPHPMIPVLIETDFDNLETAISAKLTSMLDRSADVEKPILDELLKAGRLLVIVDHYSELSEKTRATFDSDLPTLPANALIVTSRTGVSSLPSPLIIEQQPISRTPALSAFLESYLSEVPVDTRDGELLHAIDFLDESVISDACAHLQRVSDPRGATSDGLRRRPGVTPLLAKIFATQITGSIQQRIDDGDAVGKIDFADLSPTIPSIYISYVEDLKRDAPAPKRVKSDLEALAWEAVGAHFSPRPIPKERALAVFDAQELGPEDREARLDYYANRMDVLQRQRPGSIVHTLSFTHDPISEYLAASWVVNSCGSDMAQWQAILDRLEDATAGPSATWDFLYALKLTVEAVRSEPSGIEIPDAVPRSIARLEIATNQRLAA